MWSRRQFLRASGAAGTAALTTAFRDDSHTRVLAAGAAVQNHTPVTVAANEDYWREVQQAFTLDPTNVNVSTDLATALYYAGRADEALAQFDRSLAIDPKHGQTLFNVGIVKRDGRNDPKGAIAAWERLLTSVPAYPEAARVRTMIAELKSRAS